VSEDLFYSEEICSNVKYSKQDDHLVIHPTKSNWSAHLSSCGSETSYSLLSEYPDWLSSFDFLYLMMILFLSSSCFSAFQLSRDLTSTFFSENETSSCLQNYWMNSVFIAIFWFLIQPLESYDQFEGFQYIFKKVIIHSKYILLIWENLRAHILMFASFRWILIKKKGLCLSKNLFCSFLK